MNDLFPLGDWFRHRSLRSWPVGLFLILICVPSIALVILGGRPTPDVFEHVAWIFAAYFALAWLLLFGVIVQPHHVTRPMLILVIAIALATQVPLAITLETALRGDTSNLGSSIVAIGVPEELAKALPVLAIVLIYRKRRDLSPRDYLFLGAVSGLAFGASEIVRFFTINGEVQFYLTVRSAIPSIERMTSAGNSTSASLFSVLIGPVLSYILDFVWRFVTDPITHACWAGITGYFIGLAATGRYTWYKVGVIGLAIAAVLHGLNDWGRVNGRPVWILVVIASGILLLAYAKVGIRGDRHRLNTGTPSFLLPPGEPSAYSGSPTGDTPGGQTKGRPWWEH